MAAQQQLLLEQRHPDISVRRADLTARTVLWVVSGMVVVALTLWWVST
jgi:hypothetical protein